MVKASRGNPGFFFNYFYYDDSQNVVKLNLWFLDILTF